MDAKILIKKERFDKVFDLISGAGFGAEIHPEESKLRQELPIESGKSQYIFNLKNTQVDGVREVSLDRNDIFVPNAWGVLLGLRSTTNPAIEKLFSFIPVKKDDEVSVFPEGMKNDNLEAMYSGTLTWNVDNAVMMANYPMEKFRKVPETQGAVLLDSADEAVQLGILPQWDLSENLEMIIPRMTIAGTRDHKITVSFDGSGLTFPCSDGWKPYLVLVMDGFLVKGGCEWKGGAGSNPFSSVVGQW